MSIKSRVRKIRIKLATFFTSHWKKVAVGLVVLAIAYPISRRTIFKPAPRYETAEAQVKTLTQTLEVTGTVDADKKALIHFQTPGRLAWVGVRAGDGVQQNQAIASLDKSILKKQLEKDLNAYMTQRWDFDQIREDNLVTTDNYDQYSFSNTIERLIEQEQFTLNSTVLDVEIQDITNRTATLTSPISGVVTQIDTPVAGVNVAVTDIFTVVDPQTLYFEVEVDESDIGLVSVGQKAEITLEAFPDQTFAAEITWIDFAASTSDSGGTVFIVKLSLPLSAATFRLGLTGDATITLQEKPAALSVPLDAIEEKEGRTFVRVLNSDGSITEQDVTLGLETDDDIEIVSGLEAGLTVITGERN
ncbi:MAG: efflux RND transporter periplasmic adaptor subunit [Candidatus Chisholmbacteria bacterium]|nr:efflux RND transporter periplasmic adaptor subunit [Candidatus Chisholmbacteria bacterium]